MSAAFYAENLGIDLCQGKGISDFIEKFKDHKSISRFAEWARGDLIRVYIELWSQNSLNAISALDKAFYDVEEKEIYITQYRYGETTKTPLSKVVLFGRSSFSGAKTRAAIKDLADLFYG